MQNIENMAGTCHVKRKTLKNVPWTYFVNCKILKKKNTGTYSAKCKTLQNESGAYYVNNCQVQNIEKRTVDVFCIMSSAKYWKSTADVLCQLQNIDKRTGDVLCQVKNIAKQVWGVLCQVQNTENATGTYYVNYKK